MEDEDDEDAGDGRGSLKEMGEASPSAQDTKRKVPDFNLSRRPGTEGRGHMGSGGVVGVPIRRLRANTIRRIVSHISPAPRLVLAAYVLFCQGRKTSTQSQIYTIHILHQDLSARFTYVVLVRVSVSPNLVVKFV